MNPLFNEDVLTILFIGYYYIRKAVPSLSWVIRIRLSCFGCKIEADDPDYVHNCSCTCT